MYIQLKDFNSYMSPENKDWLYIFVQSLICILLQNWCNIYTMAQAYGPITDRVLSPCGVSQLLCNMSFRYDQTENPLCTCKNCLISRHTFVFTRSENLLWKKKKKYISCYFNREINYSTFAWRAATQTQISNVFGCLQNPSILRMTAISIKIGEISC